MARRERRAQGTCRATTRRWEHRRAYATADGRDPIMGRRGILARRRCVVPRVPRCRRAPGSLEPGQVYHVTNRGVDRCDIFHSDLDRVLFLSMVAEACVLYGAVCHAFCLMTTHWHVVIED